MALTGSLSEFPLPEVLMLIGGRTGRLRLFDAAEFVPMELALCEHNLHGVHIGDALLLDRPQIIAELSYTVETGDGQFQFMSQPIVSVPRPQVLPVGELVMQLVLHVDEKLAKRRAVLAPELFYVLEIPQPAGEIKGELGLFLHQSRNLLSSGVRQQDLAEYLGLDEELVRLHLYNLHQLGVVKLIETTDVEELRQTIVEQEVSDKSEEFQLAADMSDRMRRTGRLLKLPALK